MWVLVRRWPGVGSNNHFSHSLSGPSAPAGRWSRHTPSGWAYPSWRPRFYPKKLGPDKFLSYYASRLNAVEVNYTFRRLLTENLSAKWVAATPSDFQFAVKAHQAITHFRRLQNTAEPMSKFVAGLQPLFDAHKLGPVLFQLPPNLRLDLPRFENFLNEMPKNLRAVFEFRHPSWLCENVYAMLQAAGAALCPPEIRGSKVPFLRTAGFSYLRFRKKKYSAAERKGITRHIRRLLEYGDVFVFFKHEDSPTGALHAEKLLRKS